MTEGELLRRLQGSRHAVCRALELEIAATRKLGFAKLADALCKQYSEALAAFDNVIERMKR